MTSFYGFDWQNMPSYSRLFSQPVVNRAQSAFGQGMGQFRQYDPSQLEQLRAQRQAALAARQPVAQPSPIANMYVGPDGRVYTLGTGQDASKDFLNQYTKYNQSIKGSDFERIALTVAALDQALRGDRGMTLESAGFKPLMGK